MEIDELASFVKKADSYLSEMYHIRMEFVPPDVVQLVEGTQEVTCRMTAIGFQDIAVNGATVRILVLKDSDGQFVVASHPYDLARLCYG